ncbi:carboxylic acid reductase [Streptomyces canus]|uniref:carboxylic acid reductase n=1 Tax=Streptomyces canus TaxID=58343 RepID=UPI0027D77DD9|nr:carboxylic acid reductase [Streptomyces canus]
MSKSRKQRIAELFRAEPELADSMPAAGVFAETAGRGPRLSEIVRRTLAAYADRPALGERARQYVNADGRVSVRLLPRFKTVSYGELWSRLSAVAADWYHHPQHPLREGDFVAILGFAGTDYTTVDLACGQVGAVAVPLHTNASVDHIRHLVTEAAPRVFATSTDRLATVLDALAGQTCVHRILVFDHHPELPEHREALAAAARLLASTGAPMSLELLSDVVGRTDSLPPVPELPPDSSADGALSALIYTSGSTGTPKGVMFPESTVSLMWRPPAGPENQYPLITANFLPQSHLVARRLVIKTLATGGTAHFVADSDLSTLLDDLALIRPTEIAMVPRVCELLFESYHAQLNQRAARGELRDTDHAEVIAHLRDHVLGGRVIHAPCGSAPLAPELAAFLRNALDVPLLDSYGTTETGLVMLDHRVQSPPVVDYKLVDVPELGYSTADSPYPRGELLVRTALITPGYYRRAQDTAEVFDQDGYYRTGDIMAETAPGELIYLDRRKNVLKLSQGEFVALSKVEAALVASPLVRQIFVYGNSSRSYLLAVVVPTPEAIAQSGDEAALKAAVSRSLQSVATQAGLAPYEVPRDLIVEPVPFSQDNGLLTDSTKQLRPRLKERYGERLEQRYAELAEGQAAELRAVWQDHDRPVAERVARAAQALLPGLDIEPGPEQRFTDLGGDSLSALSFANLLREIFGIEVSVGTVLGPANTLGEITAHVERLCGAAAARRATFAAVHGEHTASVRAGDLTLDKFIDAATLTASTELPQPVGEPRTVLLTGANGYLGRLLCLEWLQRLAPVGGTLVCLVRAADDSAARLRLEESLDSGDTALKTRFAELTAGGALRVLAGDIGAPHLGLGKQDWQHLTATVDLIVHPAALVNHVLPYRQLFEPNVVGTAEVVHAALTTRLKPVVFVSSVAVAAHGAATADEDSDIRDDSPARALDDRHAGGYATSKWAGEVLLREAHDLCGLPVTVFRSGMILAHARYAGQLNVPDTFTRLLLSLIATGTAPESFYDGAQDGRRPRAHYDGLPGDFVAAAVAALGFRTDGYRTFNVVNPHDDGISLDTVVDWLADSGINVRRVGGHRQWREQFESALQSLPLAQRPYSLLPLIAAWREPLVPRATSALPADRFRAAVRAVGIGTEQDIPHLSRPLIEKYVADLRLLGLL